MDYQQKSIIPVCSDIKDPGRANMLSIITAKSCARIYIDDIEFIEQTGRKLELVTNDLQYSVYESMNNLIPYFENRGFYRVMKGMLINFDKIKTINGECVCFESGKRISMGRNNICRTRTAFKKYLRQYPTYIYNEMKLSVAEKNEEKY